MDYDARIMKGGFYYAPREAISGDKIVLPPDESRHALRAMRLSTGAEIQIVDGEGTWYLAGIINILRGTVTAEIQNSATDVGEPGYDLTVGIGVLKNAGRFETVLEKAVELGVTRVVPLETERTQKVRLNQERCKRVMIAGLKQSMRSRLPELTEIQTLESVVRAEPGSALRLIAHEGVDAGASLLSLAELVEKAAECVILIGPEGGFTDVEIELAAENGLRRVSLGTSRLRAETAAIAAAAAIHMIKSNQNSPHGVGNGPDGE